MTLLEKFENVYIDFQIQAGIIKYNELYEASNQCEQIADDYAIEFAEWIRFNVIEVSQGWQFDGKFYNDEQLLEIFKKEKGL
jgi:hypothetical protein